MKPPPLFSDTYSEHRKEILGSWCVRRSGEMCRNKTITHSQSKVNTVQHICVSKYNPVRAKRQTPLWGFCLFCFFLFFIVFYRALLKTKTGSGAFRTFRGRPHDTDLHRHCLRPWADQPRNPAVHRLQEQRQDNTFSELHHHGTSQQQRKLHL